jgi:L,D-transpeptidase ErfK/SrfK
MSTKLISFLFLLTFPITLHATRYPMPEPGNDIIGEIISVQAQSGETLTQIGKRYGVGYHEMIEANPSLKPESLAGGEEVIVPSQYVLPKYRKGIVINLAELRLYYFTPDKHYVFTYPVGLGRRGWRTPTTSTTVVKKTANPTWTVPPTIRTYVLKETGKLLPDSMPPGPENPLGPYALYLGTSGYLIHGTNQPWTIGKLITAGCIRLYNADVAELYPHVAVGTPVKIVHYPYKAGWQNGRLYLEAHVPITQHEPSTSQLNVTSINDILRNTTHPRTLISWEKVDETLQAQRGLPEPIGLELQHD